MVMMVAMYGVVRDDHLFSSQSPSATNPWVKRYSEGCQVLDNIHFTILNTHVL